MRLCIVATLAAGAAWHDGHAIGEKKGRENGSAIFLILIAVVLFAALTAALNHSSRTSTGMVSDQQARLAATDIIAYGGSVKQTVQKLLLQGCSESEISFENDSVEGYEHPDGSPDRCKVFHPQGGGLTLQAPPAPHNKTGPSFWNGRYAFTYGTTWKGQGTTCTEERCDDLLLLLYLSNDGITCQEINKMLGYRATPTDTTFGGAQYQGTFYYDSMLADESGGSEAENKDSACFYRTDSSLQDYVYTQVLIAR